MECVVQKNVIGKIYTRICKDVFRTPTFRMWGTPLDDEFAAPKHGDLRLAGRRRGEGSPEPLISRGFPVASSHMTTTLPPLPLRPHPSWNRRATTRRSASCASPAVTQPLCVCVRYLDLSRTLCSSLPSRCRWGWRWVGVGECNLVPFYFYFFSLLLKKKKKKSKSLPGKRKKMK